ncbi:hypothetical protein [Novosphingobium profundi]|uniref:hypothetical protein n=1 Tax=Novosphingobium profundi TaxID=1774954 RepID=UPI001BDB57D3|nr:hypothetical protein [Novosphingobium profundi]
MRSGIAGSASGYFGVGCGEPLGGTFLEALREDAAFHAACHAICEQATAGPLPRSAFYQILRCLTGSAQSGHAMRFHYDSYVLTALIPILVPETGTGRLLLRPPLRPLRRSYLVNVLDKARVDNPLAQALYRRGHARHDPRLQRVALRPGDLYLFWGYRTLHTNEPADDEGIRATALFHYHDPHAHSGVKRALRPRR